MAKKFNGYPAGLIQAAKERHWSLARMEQLYEIGLLVDTSFITRTIDSFTKADWSDLAGVLGIYLKD